MNETEYLIDDLRLIASLTPGMIIYIRTKSLIHRKAAFSFAYKTWNSESRGKTIEWISSTLDSAVKEYEVTEDTELLEDIERSLLGFTTMSVTYSDDPYVEVDVTKIITNTRSRLSSLNVRESTLKMRSDDTNKEERNSNNRIVSLDSKQCSSLLSCPDSRKDPDWVSTLNESKDCRQDIVQSKNLYYVKVSPLADFAQAFDNSRWVQNGFNEWIDEIREQGLE